MATVEDVAKTMVVLATAFKTELTAERIELYAKFLEDIDGELLNAAASRCVTNLKFFPTVAEIRTFAVEFMSSTLPDPLSAWNEVHKMILAYGYGRFERVPGFSHPAITDAVTALGWNSLCQHADDEWLSKKFIDTYGERLHLFVDDLMMLPSTREYRDKQIAAQAGIKQLADVWRS